MFSDSLRYTNSPPLSPSPSSSGGTTTGAGPPQPYYAQGTQGNAPPGAQPPKPPMMASIRAFAADFCLLRFAEVAVRPTPAARRQRRLPPRQASTRLQKYS